MTLAQRTLCDTHSAASADRVGERVSENNLWKLAAVSHRLSASVVDAACVLPASESRQQPALPLPPTPSISINQLLLLMVHLDALSCIILPRPRCFASMLEYCKQRMRG